MLKITFSVADPVRSIASLPVGDTLHDQPTDRHDPLSGPPDPAPALDSASAHDAIPAPHPMPAFAPDAPPPYRSEPLPSPPYPAQPLPPYLAHPVSRRRWWVLFALVGAIVIAGAATIVGFVVMREDEPEKWAAGDCVALAGASLIEFDCDQNSAAYRIKTREEVRYPVESACTKYSEVTKAMAEPVTGDAQPGAVLCLVPTRFNMSDPGALQALDCIDVKNSGATITRIPCVDGERSIKVIGTELHTQVPVTDHACQSRPEARNAFAQTSLGGRAIVVCATDTDPTDMNNAKVGDCASDITFKLVPCTNFDADRRVLTVEVVYQKPVKPQCADVFGANAFSMRTTETTDLVLAVCMGPGNPNDSLYATVGDCIYDPVQGTGKASDTKRVDCADPAANMEVIDRHSPDDGKCPSGWAAALTYEPGVTNGLTICLGRR
ncbi:LppU/SCO3897 family protein [Nocardia sp. IFM 10818]